MYMITSAANMAARRRRITSSLRRDSNVGMGGFSWRPIRIRAQLAFLSPRIQAAILDGSQPPDLSLERIVRTGVPLDWSEQERVFGFSA